jgi:hypothetical protein
MRQPKFVTDARVSADRMIDLFKGNKVFDVARDNTPEPDAILLVDIRLNGVNYYCEGTLTDSGYHWVQIAIERISKSLNVQTDNSRKHTYILDGGVRMYTSTYGTKNEADIDIVAEMISDDVFVLYDTDGNVVASSRQRRVLTVATAGIGLLAIGASLVAARKLRSKR